MFAVSKMAFMVNAPGDPMMNLDCVETTSPETSSCVTTNGKLPDAVLDGRGGIDNAFGAVVGVAGGALDLEDMGYEQRRVGLVFELGGVTLPPADSRFVSLTARTGFHHDPPGDGGCQPWSTSPDSGSDGWPLLFDDVWCVDNPDGGARDTTVNGWAEDGGTTIKAQFLTLRVPFAPSPPGILVDAGEGPEVPKVAQALLHNVNVKATLSGTSTAHRLHGYLAGVLTDDALIREVVGIRQCGREQLPPALDSNRALLCSVRDLALDGDRDTPCDSYSVVLEFEAYEVRDVTNTDVYTFAECAATVAAGSPDAVLTVPACPPMDAGN